MSVSSRCSVDVPCRHTQRQASAFAAVDLNHRLRKADLLELPNGWDIEGALLDPVNDDELEPILETLSLYKLTERWLDETYAARNAVLTLWLAQLPKWEPRSRYGAAFTNIIIGMRDHDFVPHRLNIPLLWAVPGDLFETFDLPSKLSTLLHELFINSTGHAAAWALSRKSQRPGSAALQAFTYGPPPRRADDSQLRVWPRRPLARVGGVR